MIGGPSGAGKSTLAARVVDGGACSIQTRHAPRSGPTADRGPRCCGGLEDLRATLAAGRGAVAVTTALRDGHRLGLAKAGSRAHHNA